MAKFAMMVSPAFLMVLLVVVEYSAVVTLASLADVNINNEIQGATADAVIVDCFKRSNGQHFAVQTLWVGQHWGWGFTPNAFGLTKYYCDFWWGGKHQRVLAWVDEEFFPGPKSSTWRPCTHCLWRVTREGFYRTTTDFGKPLSTFISEWLGP